jgi:phage terminase large subunit-like protein
VAKRITRARSKRAADWIEAYLRVPEGRLVGQPVTLTKQQREWLKLIYDSPTRTFILSMGRKNAKTTFSAMLLLLHLVGPEAKANSQLFSAAQSRDQAGILFSLASKMVRLSPDLCQVVQIRDTAKSLLCPELGTVYRALSADASTNYGLSPSFVVHDELGQVKGPRSELYEALETASAAQGDPLSVVISTQAPTDADLLSLLIDDAKTGADPRVKLAFYTAPMTLDPFGMQAIKAANPHLSQFMNIEEVQRQAQDAKRMPSRESSYRNLILNQRVEARQPFVSRSVWEDNGAMPDGELPAGPCWFGLDLSSVSDLTALVGVSKRGDGWDVHPTFWLPEDGLADKARADRVPWDVWQGQGFLRATPGASIQYDFIAEYLRWLFDNCDVRGVAFDRYNMRFLKPCLSRAGFSDEEMERFKDFGQGFVSMSPALRELETLLLARQLRHGMHPVLTMCAANATVQRDPADNRKFTKTKSSGRIDGMVALAMAVSGATVDEQTTSDLCMVI